MEEAQKIAKRRDLKLVQVIDLSIKSPRPIFKLMTSAEILSEELKQREEKKKNKKQDTVKGEKLLTIGGRISEHDLASKIQNVQKWLKKNYEVRVIISCDGDKAKQESIASRFEASTKDIGKMSPKRFSDNNLRFQILPTKASDSGDQAPEVTVPGKKSSKDLLDGKQNPAPDGAQSARAFHSSA